MKRSRLAKASVPILGVSAVLLVGAAVGASHGDAPPLAWRPFTARLSGFAYSPVESANADADLDLQLERSQLFARWAQSYDPVEAARGEAWQRVLRHDLAGAASVLEGATADRDDPDLVADLAAVYLAEAERNAAPFAAVQALDLLARLPTPRSAQAELNRALALESLSLREEARQAWLAAALASPEMGWRQLAEDRARALAERTLEDEWRAVTAALGLERTADEVDGALDQVVRFPGEAFDLVAYSLLDTWSKQCGDGPGNPTTCARLLDRVGAIAARLPADQGEPLTTAVSQARKADAVDRRRLARGYRALSAGFALAGQRQSRAARESLDLARVELGRAGSPLLPWATYWHAATDLYDGHFARLESALQALAAVTTERRLQASIWRTLGSSALRQERPAAAAERYEHSLAAFDAQADSAAAGAVAIYLADTYAELGRVDDEWRTRLAGLGRLAQWPSRAGWLDALNYSAGAAAYYGELAAAVDLAEISARWSTRQSPDRVAGDPVRQVETQLFLAGAHRAAGEQSAAQHALDEAATHTLHIADASLRDRLVADLLLSRSLSTAAGLPVTVTPQQRVDDLTTAVAHYQRLGVYQDLPRAYGARAQAWLALGRSTQAESDLVLGLRAQNRALSQLGDPFTAAQLANDRQQLYDAMIALALGRHDHWRAAMLADRARDELFVQTSFATTAAGTDDDPQHLLLPATVQSTLAADDAMLVFTVLPGQLMTTVIRSDGMASTLAPLGENQLATGARTLLGQLATDSADAADFAAASGDLYAQLVRPQLPQLVGIRRLIVVPDRSLRLVPFAALFGPERGRYLIDDFALCVAPSVGQWVRQSQRLTQPGAPTAAWRAAVFAPDNSVPAAEAIPAAGREAATVAALYATTPRLGDDASRVELLAALAFTDVLHFAGHARSEPGSPERSRLLFAGDPPLALYAAELRRHDLSHLALVVLSACETGLPSSRRTIASDGIATTFLAGGATAVVATLWRVDDAASAALMVAFHRRVAAGSDLASALQAAQLELLHGSDPRLQRPAAWAFAQLTGLPIRRPLPRGQ